MKIRHRPLAAMGFIAALFFAGQALWVPAKASLGQRLLERAWTARQAGHLGVKPWPWADTEPVGVLEIPRLGLRQLVLEGASGKNLAWGPASLTPIAARDVVLSGHRDTHFRQLGALAPGDQLLLTGPHGVRRFRVAWLDIVDSRNRELVLEADRERLTLVTCYPFHAADPGGPLRLVVTALPERPPAPYSADRVSQSAMLSGTTR